MPDLEVLDVSKNVIVNVNCLRGNESSSDDSGPPKGPFSRLQKLNLSGNRLNELLGIRCPSLRELDLSQNELRRVEGLEGAPQLRELNLNNNQITDASKIRDLPLLEKVLLKANRSKNLPKIETLPRLKFCLMRDNYV